MLTPTQKNLCDARPNTIDLDQTERLHYLGNYVRRLPSNLQRMMENAYDWEHLPHIHSSSFSSIELISSGKWGWRAKVGLPGANGSQLIDLLVDQDRNYWATTVISGMGEGLEIHTQASEISAEEIEVDVRFYAASDPGDPELTEMTRQYMVDQYRQLYDEDEGLMTGRQSALDDRERWWAGKAANEIHIGPLADLSTDTPHIVETDTDRFCVRHWNGKWIAHSAVCPHLLGPLSEGEIDANGDVTCPWHGYRFNVETGENRDGKCKALAAAPELVERDGVLYLVLTGERPSTE